MPQSALSENVDLTPRERARLIMKALEERYPEAPCALLANGDPFRLLVMARLSAQCTDARVNTVAPALFARYPNAAAMANADREELEGLIRSCGLYRSKADHLIRTSALLVDQHDGKVPQEMDQLLALPGIGRKIANLLRGDLFGFGGIVADTHCIRLCGRFGFYPTALKDPIRVEKILTPLIPQNEQSDFCHRLVLFGREICTARNPACEICPLSHLCAERKKSQKMQTTV